MFKIGRKHFKIGVLVGIKTKRFFSLFRCLDSIVVLNCLKSICRVEFINKSYHITHYVYLMSNSF